MFYLEQVIADWRKQMLAAGIQTPVPLEELEIHLREEIEQQIRSGLNEQAAFDAAKQKIGQAGAIEMEFKKSGTSGQWNVFMKTTRTPIVFFAILLLGYVGFLFYTVSWLPPQMASHFDASGRPNGWMNRSSAAIFQGSIGLILPLIIATAFCAIRFVPPQGIKVPNRDYWFAPERREKTYIYISRQGLWLACLMVGLQAMFWFQILESNRARAPYLSPWGFLITLGIFGMAMIIWAMKFFRYFTKAA